MIRRGGRPPRRRFTDRVRKMLLYSLLVAPFGLAALAVLVKAGLALVAAVRGERSPPY